MKARRMHAAALFAEGKSQADVMRLLQVSRQTASRWFQTWKRHGRRGLAGTGREGRPPKVGPEEFKRLERALLRGPGPYGYSTDRWTLACIAAVIA